MNTLPSEYQELEYLEGTGTQYIDTEWTPKSNGYFQIEFEFTGFFGSDKDWILGRYTDTSFLLGTKNGSSANLSIWDRTSGYQNIAGTATANYRYLISYDYATGLAIANNYTYSLTKIKTDSYPLYLFRAAPEANYNSKSRVYSLVFKENGVIVKHFIPVKKKANSELGMYDIINNKFYTNKGTGTFIAGREVHQKAIYINIGGSWQRICQEVEYR